MKAIDRQGTRVVEVRKNEDGRGFPSQVTCELPTLGLSLSSFLLYHAGVTGTTTRAGTLECCSRFQEPSLATSHIETAR